MTEQAVVKVSLNTRIKGKPETWLASYADGWTGESTTLQGLADAVRLGYAFVPAEMSSGHRCSSAFVGSELAVIDIDGGLDLDDFQSSNPLSGFASFLYTTASHQDKPGEHRFRVVFRLPQRITDGELYKALITLLIRAFGGDKSCSDPCRLFYGNPETKITWVNPLSTLPTEIIDAAREEHRKSRERFSSGSGDHDELAVEQAVFVLDEILEPTSDGERDQFIRVTAACASAGSDLYPAWSDWASRGHHGKGKNAKQTSERFFRGFSGRSTLATLFFLASEQDPDWRKNLPDELRSSGGNFSPTKYAVGYAHSDFMGTEEDAYDPAMGIPEREPTAVVHKTMSILDVKPGQWDHLNQPAPAKQPEQQVVAQSGPPDFDDGPIPESEPPEDFIDDPDMDPAPDPGDAPIKRGKGRPKKEQSGENEVLVIKSWLDKCYPGLRLNNINLNLEYGPRETPKTIASAQEVYITLSANASKLFNKQIVADITNLIARANSYNPIVDYLERVGSTTEPVEYFDHIATTLLGVEQDERLNPVLENGQTYADVVLQRFLIGAVARAFKPGCTHDWLPILIGDQNVGKSKFFQLLTPPAVSDDSHPWTATIQYGLSYLKDRPHLIHAGWIVVLDEIDRYFQRRFTEDLKNLVSISTDCSARKWENERTFPRAFVLAGASNRDDFIVDPTGNRRFMPIKVTGVVRSPEAPGVRIVDLDRLKLDRDRIWAAAYRAYKDGASSTFSSGELSTSFNCSKHYIQDSPIRGALQLILDRSPTFILGGRPCYTMVHIYESLDLELRDFKPLQQDITDELKRLGYVNRQQRVSGKSTRFWTLGEPTSGQVKPWE